MKKTIFISMSPGGISNRIKTLISCMRLADKFNGEFLLYWPKTWACNIEFENLFQNNIKQISKKELKKILKSKNFKYYKDDENILNSLKKKFSIFSGWRLILLKNEMSRDFLNKQSIDFEFEKIPLKIQEEFVKYFNELKPILKIEKKINSFSKKNNLKKCIGIHIRRGDFLNSKEGLEKVSSDEKFIKKIEEILKKNSKEKFFLSTDSKEIEEKLKKLFPKNILTYSKSNFKREDKEFIQNGLIDLYLLSKTKYILGTYLSTFNELAWWLGKCRKKVEIMATEKEKIIIAKNRKKHKQNLLNNFKREVYNTINPLHKRLLNIN